MVDKLAKQGQGKHLYGSQPNLDVIKAQVREELQQCVENLYSSGKKPEN